MTLLFFILNTLFLMVRLLLTLLFAACCLLLQAQVPRNGQKITKSLRFSKGLYRLNSPGLDKPVLVISGDNIVVDFSDAQFQGSNDRHRPDAYYGLAVLVQGGKNITLKNLKARGYKVAVLAEGVEGLTLENCDLSYNYRQHLNSTQEKEDLSDWMSYHQNEKEQWLRYGAAIYLKDCLRPVVRACRVTGGQNALMMNRCDSGQIYNNDFSFNSGIGLGLYRSSDNSVLYNRLNFNVRGYSHGVYHRGQDSAGILVYEQSNRNLFYRNSVTHGGDGFFLWAGQTTMDTGQGGCNDNILLRNDFSYAPTNGIEVTFSRNRISENRIYECDHGIWGGYSYQTRIEGNQFRNNRIAIAIEHGQDNTIHHNLFFGDQEGIRLWSRSEQPSDWGYARVRDTRSRGYRIVSNSFNRMPLVYRFSRTDSVALSFNTYSDCGLIYKLDTTVTGLDSSLNDELLVSLSEELPVTIPDVGRPANPFTGNGKWAGRKNIRMTEWGPYDFRYPLLWNTNPTDSGDRMEFELLGPKGSWRIVSVKGVADLSVRKGSLPATVTARKLPGKRTDIEIVAEFTGEAFRDAQGIRSAAKKPYRFAFRKFFQPIPFTVQWFPFDSLSNPVRDTAQLRRLIGLGPVKTEKTDRIDYAWWGGIKADRTYARFLTVAEGEAVVHPGVYELSITWDDAVRVYLDGKSILNEWNPALYTFDESPNRVLRVKLNGRHRFRVEHAELGGFATLSLKLKRL